MNSFAFRPALLSMNSFYYFPYTYTTISASSVLQRNTKLYGPMNALKQQANNSYNNSSSSWNSEGNCPGDTFLLVQFARPVRPTLLKLQFQAGFSARICHVWAVDAVVVVASNEETNNKNTTGQERQPPTTPTALLLWDEMELEDVHELQECQLGENGNNNDNARIESVQGLKLVLQDFTDFYGRVILYRLEIWGRETQQNGV